MLSMSVSLATALGCLVQSRRALRHARASLALRAALDLAESDADISAAVNDAIRAAGGPERLSEKERSAIQACARLRAGVLRSLAASESQAATDPLTGLLNRRAMESSALKLSSSEPMYSVAVADLDHFKALNDQCGHAAGDTAICLFADALALAARDEDVVCRFGGEEFVVVFRGLTQAHGEVVLQQVRAYFAASIRASALPDVTASFGIAEVAVGDTFDSVFGRADQALLRAKREGRDRIVAATRPGKYREIDRDESRLSVLGLR